MNFDVAEAKGHVIQLRVSLGHKHFGPRSRALLRDAVLRLRFVRCTPPRLRHTSATSWSAAMRSRLLLLLHLAVLLLSAQEILSPPKPSRVPSQLSVR